jgi:hypothetical protein
MPAALIRHQFEARRLAVDAVAAGEAVVVGLHGPGFNATPGDQDTVGQVYYVFSLRDGKIIHWRTYRARQDALAAAGTTGHAWK